MTEKEQNQGIKSKKANGQSGGGEHINITNTENNFL